MPELGGHPSVDPEVVQLPAGPDKGLGIARVGLAVRGHQSILTHPGLATKAGDRCDVRLRPAGPSTLGPVVGTLGWSTKRARDGLAFQMWRWPVLLTLVMGALDSPAHYLHWGPILVSVPNLIVILTMILIFVLALVIPFPKDKDDES